MHSSHPMGSVYSCIHWVTPQCITEECSNNFSYNFKPNVPAYEPTPVVVPALSLLCIFAENWYSATCLCWKLIQARWIDYTFPNNTHTRMHAHTHACTHTCMHAHMHTHTRTCTHTCMKCFRNEGLFLAWKYSENRDILRVFFSHKRDVHQ